MRREDGSKDVQPEGPDRKMPGDNVVPLRPRTAWKPTPPDQEDPGDDPGPDNAA